MTKKRKTLAPQWMPAVAVTAGVLSAMPAVAQESDQESVRLEKITAARESIKQERVQSSKFERPLIDTPQSIQVVPSKVLNEQGAQTLQEVLRNVPGITFSMGEAGAGWGDMFTMRGFSAEQSVTVDETRESALSTRTDIFNIENVNVFKGTGSFESGVAAIGGSINLSSKLPKLDSFNHLHLGVGTDDYRRATVDLNHMVSDTIAFRLNAMGHKNGVADRGPVEMKRWGIAPSITFGLGTPTRLNLSYFYQKDENIPDTGIPINVHTAKRMDGIAWDYWGGNQNYDIEETKTQRFSAKLEHDFSDKVRVSNTFSWSRVDRFTNFTTAGRLLNSTARNASDYWGHQRGTTELTYPTGYMATPRIANMTKSYRGETYANQTNLNLKFNTGSVEHSMLIGVEWYQESYRDRPWSRTLPDNSSGRKIIDVRNPQQFWSGPVSEFSSTSKAGAKVQNIGIYVYDSVKLNPKWEVAGGLRFDRYHAKWYKEDGSREPNTQKNNIWSGRLGIVYKPVENGSIYLSYSQSGQPSAAAMASRGGPSTGYSSSEYSPGKARTWELGTKWDLFNHNLALTAAIFQTEKTNPSDKDETGVPFQYSGKDRVRGLEITASGNITDRWSIYTGFSYLHSKIITDDQNPLDVGGRLKNVPKYTFNLWTTYAATDDLDVSLGAQYVGKRQFARGNVSTGRAFPGADITKQAPAYWVFDAALTYRVNKNVDVRLNVNNIFDKKYLSRISTSSDNFQKYAVPGAGRTFLVSTDIRF